MNNNSLKFYLFQFFISFEATSKVEIETEMQLKKKEELKLKMELTERRVGRMN